MRWAKSEGDFFYSRLFESDQWLQSFKGGGDIRAEKGDRALSKKRPKDGNKAGHGDIKTKSLFSWKEVDLGQTEQVILFTRKCPVSIKRWRAISSLFMAIAKSFTFALEKVSYRTWPLLSSLDFGVDVFNASLSPERLTSAENKEKKENFLTE